MKVYLSPSRQSANLYANKTNEATQMQKVGAVVAKELQNRGVSVFVANPSTDITARGIEANKGKYDAYIAIHSNAGGGHGTRAFYDSTSPKSKALTGYVFDELAALTKTIGKIKPYDALAEIRTPKLPVAETLVEVEFHDNLTGAKWICEHITEIGQAIAKGICKFLNVKWEKYITYTVKRGDTYFSIAKKYGIKWGKLMKDNKTINPLLRVGQVLKIYK